jgi:Carboxypeptidase regulatory-like domain
VGFGCAGGHRCGADRAGSGEAVRRAGQHSRGIGPRSGETADADIPSSNKQKPGTRSGSNTSFANQPKAHRRHRIEDSSLGEDSWGETLGNLRASKPCRKRDERHKVKKGPMVHAARNMNSAGKGSYRKSLGQNPWRLVLGGGSLLWLGPAFLLLCSVPARAQSQQSPDTPGAGAATAEQPAKPVAGTISGSVVDRTGAIVAGATVKLLRESAAASQEATSDSDGQFLFAGIAPGAFQLTITSPGFATQTSSGTLHAGEDYVAPPITLVVASAASEVQVSLTPREEAEAEIKDEEKQRVLGVIPNFYVTYNPAAVPLSPRQKFELAWKATIDPVNFGLVGAVAGIQQASNAFSGYGQGAEGYGKRYGAGYADLVTGTFIGGAILPSLLKQDPRYFYKGTGTRRARFFYAIANAVICKGDNGHWQANYSGLLGSLAAGGISNLYYPATDRDATVTFENTLIGVGTTAANNLLQEFVIRKFTHNAPTYTPAAANP